MTNLPTANAKQLLSKPMIQQLDTLINDAPENLKAALKVLNSCNRLRKVADNQLFHETFMCTGNLLTLDKNGKKAPFTTMHLARTPVSDEQPAYVPRVSEANYYSPALLKMFPPDVAKKLAEVEMPFGVRTSYVVPLQYLIKSAAKVKGTYTVYVSRTYVEGEIFIYVGITKRQPQIRLREHIQSAKSGSPYHHARKLAEHMRAGHDALIEFEIYACGLSQDAANDLEEYFVDKFSLASKYRNGLNMIPGGYAGARALAQLAHGSERALAKPEIREALLKHWLDDHPLRGRKNLVAAENWKDPAYAEAVICGPDGRMSPDQIREARYKAVMGYSIEEIVEAVKANSERQIKDLLAGKTYRRIN